MPRVRVVDDDPWVRDLLVATLAALPVQVGLATDGSSALAQALRAPPELILLDVRLPDIDGVALCRQLRAHPVTSHLPIVMLTVDLRPQTQRAALEAGADAYCTKPFSPTALLEVLNHYLHPERPQPA
jgi:two-component system, cell cycle response regulator